MEVIVSGRRKWKSDTRKEKRKPTQLSLLQHHRLLIPLFISVLHSPPSFIFLRLSLLFMVELYNSERVSIARGSALRSPVLSVQYLHGSRSQKREIYQFLSSLRGASLSSTRMKSLPCYADGHRGLYVSLPERAPFGMLPVLESERGRAIVYRSEMKCRKSWGHRTLSPAHD